MRQAEGPAVVDFGISLGLPAAEDMGDRHAYYRDVLRRGEGWFTSAWLSDHLMKDNSPTLEGWTALAFLAAEFPAYAFGNLVLSQSFRNPALLAKMAVTLHYLTGGRLILGIGAGWQADEYLAYGYPYPSAGTRVEQLDEAIDVLRAMWSQSPASYEGRHYHIRNAYCEPRPATPIQILVGGHRPKLMRIVAQKADIWQWDDPRTSVASSPRCACRRSARPTSRSTGAISPRLRGTRSARHRTRQAALPASSTGSWARLRRTPFASLRRLSTLA
jgi:alkanesulfonate monooxygenase SsuD/methylene tetrahydromethanopterin reductase-like flavin-dependent oxidoreductase (luciferase family)